MDPNSPTTDEQPDNTVNVQSATVSVDLNQASPAASTPPAAKDPAPDPAKSVEQTPAAGGQPKILLAEDEEDARLIYLDILKNAGFDADAAEDGQKTLDKLSAKVYDLLLLDIIMPDMDGITVLSEIKKYPAKYGANLKVVMLTNIGGDLAIEKALNLGANGYMLKSETEPDELINIIKKYLQGQNYVKPEKGLLG